MMVNCASLSLLLAVPVAGLQAPGALRAFRGDPFAVTSASRGSALAMQAGDDGAAVESKRSRFLRPLRSASTSVAAAVFLALVGPRGAARAAEPLEAPTHSAATNSRFVENIVPPLTFSGERGQLSVRTLSPRRGTIDQLEEDLEQSRQYETGALPADMEDLLGRDAHRQYMSRDFLFGEELTALTPLQEELDELDEYTGQSEGLVGKFKGVFTVAGTGALMYGTLRVLQAAEKAFITNEKNEMQEEMDLTGMFIAIDAGEVEGAVDPKTGKNITVSGQGDKLPKAGEPSDVAPTAGDAKPKPEAPWLLRVLGLGDSASADDDSFWEDKVAPPTQPSSTSPSGAEDVAGDGQGAEEPAEEEDDTEGIDTLEDLLS